MKVKVYAEVEPQIENMHIWNPKDFRFSFIIEVEDSFINLSEKDRYDVLFEESDILLYGEIKGYEIIGERKT